MAYRAKQLSRTIEEPYDQELYEFFEIPPPPSQQQQNIPAVEGEDDLVCKIEDVESEPEQSGVSNQAEKLVKMLTAQYGEDKSIEGLRLLEHFLEGGKEQMINELLKDTSLKQIIYHDSGERHEVHGHNHGLLSYIDEARMYIAQYFAETVKIVAQTAYDFVEIVTNAFSVMKNVMIADQIWKKITPTIDTTLGLVHLVYVTIVYFLYNTVAEILTMTFRKVTNEPFKLAKSMKTFVIGMTLLAKFLLMGTFVRKWFPSKVKISQSTITMQEATIIGSASPIPMRHDNQMTRSTIDFFRVTKKDYVDEFEFIGQGTYVWFNDSRKRVECIVTVGHVFNVSTHFSPATLRAATLVNGTYRKMTPIPERWNEECVKDADATMIEVSPAELSKAGLPGFFASTPTRLLTMRDAPYVKAGVITNVKVMGSLYERKQGNIFSVGTTVPSKDDKIFNAKQDFEVFHDATTEPGWSGGGVYSAEDKMKVVGIHVGHRAFDDHAYNLFIVSEKFYDMYMEKHGIEELLESAESAIKNRNESKEFEDDGNDYRKARGGRQGGTRRFRAGGKMIAVLGDYTTENNSEGYRENQNFLRPTEVPGDGVGQRSRQKLGVRATELKATCLAAMQETSSSREPQYTEEDQESTTNQEKESSLRIKKPESKESGQRSSVNTSSQTSQHKAPDGATKTTSKEGSQSECPNKGEEKLLKLMQQVESLTKSMIHLKTLTESSMRQSTNSFQEAAETKPQVTPGIKSPTKIRKSSTNLDQLLNGVSKNALKRYLKKEAGTKVSESAGEIQPSGTTET